MTTEFTQHSIPGRRSLFDRGHIPLARHCRLRSNDMNTVREHSKMTFGSAKPLIDTENAGAPFTFVHNQINLKKNFPAYPRL